ncbi:nitroreductase [Candidatus Roizmanbacteria bacterium CG02_land_8_20_14_3_00_36_15]|nr:MAG: nitroreductase [Candidatus Roizmanbacteria bacterium CG02_land_8_20_14_3_00_36_15]PIY70544.1 MAG: nitroreductase [Candidatus Roizmanbacteria bacterium CG_4_10_14_0_8_um_filter_36_36]PJA52653.1 MAG: nitroreductase [Candidatus Roizmanbacteria bacterium CG_4_9_14_3_um_filter_36_11]PJE60341.1 MAG: nitroreductase [Candidatus Roizmanbacteria bacterium CG10_big_fil_rev_8_21_14_0_10_36_26]
MDILKKIIGVRSPRPKFPVIEPVQKRFSPRVFSSKEVSDKDLRSIFEAARLAPSGRNNQPWYYCLIRKGANAYAKIISCLPERNSWAKSAPVIIIACYDPTEPEDIINRWALYDLGASVISLVLQAQSLGYYCRQIGSFDCNKAKKLFSIPDPLKPFVLVALGKIGDEKDYQGADPEIVKRDLQKTGRKNDVYKEIID